MDTGEYAPGDPDRAYAERLRSEAKQADVTV